MVKFSPEYKEEMADVENINKNLRFISIENYDMNENYEFDANLSLEENIARKFVLKKKGRDLKEDKKYELAIEHYLSLLKNSYFANDYYPYRHLVIKSELTKQLDKVTETISNFFKSGIYAHQREIKWFIYKLIYLEEDGYITRDEIDSLMDYYNKHGALNKEKEHDPIFIADRIFQRRNGEIGLDDQYNYEKKAEEYALKEEGRYLEHYKLYDQAIDFYTEIIDNDVKGATEAYKRLAYIFEILKEYENELEVIKEFYNHKYGKVGKYTKDYFKKRITNFNKFTGNSYTVDDFISGKDESDSELKNEIDNLKKENKDLLKRIAELENTKPKKEKPKKKNYHNISDYENKYVYEIPFNKNELDLAKPPIHEYDSSLNEFENLKRKNTLIQYGKLLTQSKQTTNAIKYYKYLCNNSYFTNDWYPYRQMTIIYDKTKDFHANLLNIKKLFHNNTYLNRYQFTWFCEKIRKILENVNADENELQEWIEYYESHGALNESKSNKFLADRFMKLNDETILVITDEFFDYRQERYALEEIGRIYERVGNYELAITHYENIIAENEYNFYKFYQRICLCLEKLEDYSRELEAIKLYYTNPPIEVSETSDKWFEKRLNKVNKLLNTHISIDDLIMDVEHE